MLPHVVAQRARPLLIWDSHVTSYLYRSDPQVKEVPSSTLECLSDTTIGILFSPCIPNPTHIPSFEFGWILRLGCVYASRRAHRSKRSEYGWMGMGWVPPFSLIERHKDAICNRLCLCFPSRIIHYTLTTDHLCVIKRVRWVK